MKPIDKKVFNAIIMGSTGGRVMSSIRRKMYWKMVTRVNYVIVSLPSSGAVREAIYG